MKILLLALLMPALQETPPPKPDEKAQQIRKALDWLADSDPEMRDMGCQQLLASGAAAVHFIEEQMNQKGAGDLLKVLREIEKAGPPADARWVSDKDLPAIEETGPKLDKGEGDRYLRAKYAEALAFARSGHYSRGFEIVNALLTLEPQSSITEKARRLRRYCDNMVTQTTFLEAKIVQTKPAYAAGEPVELTLRLRNLFKKTVTLIYEKDASGAPDAGMAVIEVEASVSEIGGMSTTSVSSAELRFEGEIPIAMGAQWEKTFTLDTSFSANEPEQVRTFVVNASTFPVRIDMGGGFQTKRIQFEPAVVRMVPLKYEVFLQNPLEWLGKTIDTGTSQETFVCAQLLGPDQKDPGTEMMIRAMEKTTNPGYRGAIAVILAFVTGEKLGPDPAKWAGWWKEREKKKK